MIVKAAPLLATILCLKTIVNQSSIHPISSCPSTRYQPLVRELERVSGCAVMDAPGSWGCNGDALTFAIPMGDAVSDVEATPGRAMVKGRDRLWEGWEDEKTMR